MENIWRLKYHIEPKSGWLNDPNGLVYFNGTYYIYHQYSYEYTGGLKYWYAYTSKDLIKYEDKGIFLKPDIKEDISGIYSGSANIENGKLAFYYTGNVSHGNNFDGIHKGREQNTIRVISEDGITFNKKEVLLKNEHYPNMSNHVRDPKIFEKGGNKYLVLGGRNSDDYGCLLIYKNFEYFRTIYSNKNLGYMWECPDYFSLDNKEILIFSPQGISRQYRDNKNMYQLVYSVINGGIEDFVKLDNYKLIDYGHDFYAAQTFLDEDNNRVMISWLAVPDSSYTHPTTNFGYQHCLSIPRVLKYENGNLRQLIHKSIYSLLGEEIKNKEFNLSSWYFKKDDGKEFKLTLDDANIEYIDGIFRVELNNTGYGRDTRDFKLNINNIEILVDSSSLEIFINNGEFTFTTRYYPSNHHNIIKANNYILRKVGNIEVK